MSSSTRSDDTSPIFVVCIARSGSTLLRYCLDSHPDIACPPETNLSSLLAGTEEATLAIPAESKEAGFDAVVQNCRLIADRILGEFARSQGKSRWCDKSLATVNNLPLVMRIFPDAKYICLFRECTDTVISGIVSSPWGYNAYGFTPYAAAHPDNFVLGLVQNWIEKTATMLEFLDNNPHRAMPIRYEDLTKSPESVLRGIYDFLGCSWDPSLATNERIFGTPHAKGNGDHKIEGSDAILSKDAGEGWRIPRGMIPEPMRERADQILQRLDYPSLSDIYDLSSTKFDWYGNESDTALRLINYLGTALESGSQDEWHFGGGKLLIVDQMIDLRLDPPSKIMRYADKKIDSGVGAQFSIVTDAKTAESVMSGTLPFTVAFRDGHFNVFPSKRIVPQDYQQFHIEISDLFHSADRT